MRQGPCILTLSPVQNSRRLADLPFLKLENNLLPILSSMHQRCPRFCEDTFLFEAGSGLVVSEHYMDY
jgi:hypothetical protein